MKRLFIIDVKEGMRTASDILSDTGIMIIPKGVILTDAIINHLVSLGIIDVDVEDEIVSPEEIEASGSAEPEEELDEVTVERQKRIEHIKEEYDGVKEQITDAFKSIASGKMKKDDVEGVLSAGWDLFKKNNIGGDILGVLFSMRDFSDETYRHCMNVAMISALLARWLGWKEKDVKTAYTAGLFHDIGKLFVPKDILNKPGALTPEEREQIQKHTVLGYQTLKKSGMDDIIANAAVMHHERCDGTGYPLKLTGDKIDKFAKVVAIADVYDAMTADRVYRDGICPFDVIAKFEEEDISSFETGYLLTFIQHIVDSYIHSGVRLSSGEKAEIILINKQRNSRPLVITTSGKAIDLSRETRIKIDKVLSV